VSSDRTFFIIKPDAVKAGSQWQILTEIESRGFALLALKKLQLSRVQAEGFYAVHKQRPFFNDLVAFMTSGPVFVGVLEKEAAVEAWRALMGPTDSTKAPKDTIRGRFGTDIQFNAVHGSDSAANAAIEIRHFFNCIELP
jgi:nucleoside-diphosphate kinase